MYTINFEDTGNSGLHDFRLLSIEVDYFKASVHFALLDPQNQECTLDIFPFTSFQIERREPWGAGTYVCESYLKWGHSGYFKLTLTLNSGDDIVVEFINKKRADELIKLGGC